MMNNFLRPFANLGFVVTAVLSGLVGWFPSAAAAAAATAPEPRIKAAQFREDLDFLRLTLTQAHPDLRFSTKPEALDKAMELLASEVRAPVTRDEAWRRLATLNPLLADGHLFVGFPDWRAGVTAHLRNGGTLFPYEVELVDGSVQIRALLGGADTPLRGTKIIAINGESVDRIAPTLLKRAHGDTPLFRSNLLAQRWWYYYWKMFGPATTYRLTLQGGDNRPASIDTPGSRETPAMLHNEAVFDRQFRFAFQPDGSALLTVNSFAPDDRDRFLAFTRDAFTQLRLAGSAVLVIDIGANGGGDDAPWLEGLMPYLATGDYRTGSTYKRKVLEANAQRGERIGDIVTGSIETWHTAQLINPLRFRGKTLVRIGPGTYSSAVLFANVMYDFCFGTLVGEGGAARRTQSGGVRQFILPNSKLALWVPRFVLDPPAGAAPGALLGPATDRGLLCTAASR
jgi:hypothetical protein